MKARKLLRNLPMSLLFGVTACHTSMPASRIVTKGPMHYNNQTSIPASGIVTKDTMHYNNNLALPNLTVEKEARTNTMNIAGIFYADSNQASIYETNRTRFNRTNELPFVAFLITDMETTKDPVRKIGINRNDVFVFEAITNAQGSYKGLKMGTNGPNGIKIVRKFRTASTNNPLEVVTSLESVFDKDLYRPNILGKPYFTPLVTDKELADTNVFPRLHIPGNNKYRENIEGSITFEGPIFKGQRMKYADYITRTNIVAIPTNALPGYSTGQATDYVDNP